MRHDAEQVVWIDRDASTLSGQAVVYAAWHCSCGESAEEEWRPGHSHPVNSMTLIRCDINGQPLRWGR